MNGLLKQSASLAIIIIYYNRLNPYFEFSIGSNTCEIGYSVLTRSPTYRAKNHLQDQRTTGDDKLTLVPGTWILNNNKAR
jgi:hypothetical protein